MILSGILKLNNVACYFCSCPSTISSIEKTPLCQTAEMYSGYSELQNFQLFAAAYRSKSTFLIMPFTRLGHGAYGSSHRHLHGASTVFLSAKTTKASPPKSRKHLLFDTRAAVKHTVPIPCHCPGGPKRSEASSGLSDGVSLVANVGSILRFVVFLVRVSMWRFKQCTQRLLDISPFAALTGWRTWHLLVDLRLA